MTRPPEIMQKVLWNVDVNSLDVEGNANRLIFCTLRLGGDDQVEWMFATYGMKRIREWVVEDSRGLRTLPTGCRRFWLLALAPEVWAEEESDTRTADIVERWRPRRQVP